MTELEILKQQVLEIQAAIAREETKQKDAKNSIILEYYKEVVVHKYGLEVGNNFKIPAFEKCVLYVPIDCPLHIPISIQSVVKPLNLAVFLEMDKYVSEYNNQVARQLRNADEWDNLPSYGATHMGPCYGRAPAYRMKYTTREKLFGGL